MAIEVTEYDPAWPEQFTTIAAEIAAALGATPSTIEHVGSTAVVGLAAKPIIDIDVIVSADDIPATIEALEAIGYEHRGELGIPDRHAFLAPDDDPARNVYVVVEGSLPYRNHIGVRDVLRSNDALRGRYAALKQQLAMSGDLGRVDYMIAKTELIHEILGHAGISQDELAEIAVHTTSTVPIIRGQ